MLRSSGTLTRTQLGVILLVVVVLGFLFTVQVRSQANADRYLQQQDNVTLGLLITGLSKANNQLLLARVDLAGQQQRLSSDVNSQATDPPSLTQDLSRLQIVDGTTPVRGPGLQIVVGFRLRAFELEDLSNALRQAGAEALQVNGYRITARTPFSDRGNQVAIDDQVTTAPFTFLVVGDPQSLVSNGQDIVAQLKPRGAATLQQVALVQISAVVPDRPVVYSSTGP